MRGRSGALIAVAFLVIGCASSPQPSSGSTAGASASPAPPASEGPSVLPSIPPTVAPVSPEPSVAAALAWQEVAPQAGGEMAGFSAGYVALANQDVDSKVFYSADGVTWNSVTLPFPASKDSHGNALGAVTEAIASNGAQVIVVGGYSHTPCATSSGGTGGGPACPSSPIAWLTSDGTHWQSSYPWAGPGPAKGLTQGNQFMAVWSIPGSGWDAASFDVADEDGSSGGLFHSADGLSWTKITSPSANHSGSAPLEFWHLGLADATGRRLIGGYWYPNGESLLALFTSADGKAWSSVATFHGADTSVDSGIAPIDSLRPLWVVAGSDANSLPTVWTSPDLASWTAHELPTLPGAQGSVASIAVTHLGYIAVGQLSDGTDGNAYHSSWVSTDGLNWTQLDTPSTKDGDGPDVLADGPGGVIGFALYNGASTPVGAWLLK
jgi:hypothetical protein